MYIYSWNLYCGNVMFVVCFVNIVCNIICGLHVGHTPSHFTYVLQES